jgi:hypothetical protein
VDIGLLQQFPPNRFPCAAFKQHTVRHYDGRSSMNLQARFQMLQEVELLIAGGRPEVVADVGQPFFALVAFLLDHRNPGLVFGVNEAMRLGERVSCSGR